MRSGTEVLFMKDTTNKTTGSNANATSKQRFASEKIATYAMYFAIIFVAFNLDAMLSMIWPIKFAIITIATVCVLTLLSRNYLEAALVGAFFGLSSLLSQLYMPKVPEFLNPIVSVLPRIAVSLAAFTVFRIMRKVTAGKEKSEIISCILAGGTAPVVNTILVMMALSISRSSPYLTMIQGILVTNFVPEFLGGLILVPLIAPVVAKAMKLPLAGIKLHK